ncbi:MAG: tetratricopeptide repeat protein [Duganella sp.]
MTAHLLSHGDALLAAGDLAGAAAMYSDALAADPSCGLARANLGYVRERQGALLEAELHYLQALVLLPEHPQLVQNYGVLLHKLKRFDESEAAALLAVRLAPGSPSAWNQLGVLLACVKREEEAEACYRHALALDPGFARARFNLAYVLLRQGRLEEGWPLLEARWQFEPMAQAFDCAPWQGESLKGKSIVIALEAGQGDMIHFCRYAALLKQRGAARVAVACHASLRRLFATLPGVDDVVASPAPMAGWDYWTHPMRLPSLFGTVPATIPAAIPYLCAEPMLAQLWCERLAAASPAGSTLRVGLAWQGNPDYENDADRSLPSLQTLAPLAFVEGVTFVSLQKGAAEAQAAQPPSGMRLLAIASELHDFADTAAVIANLDLVISVDTAVAHLAGAMGKPCWLLLPDYRCDWRWMTARDDTPWYPAMRLFRQPTGGDWDGVVSALAAALAHR